MPKGGKLERLLSRIQSRKDVDGRSSAIAIAKSEGLIRQDGDSLSLTEKGRNSDA